EHFQEGKKDAQALRNAARSLLGAIPESLTEKALAKMPLVQQVGKAAAAAEKQLGEKTTYTMRLLKRPVQYPRLADPYDSKADLNARARSYLPANCSQCHVLAGGGNAMIDLEFNTAAGKMQLFGVRPQHDSFKIADAALVAPGHPERSVLLQRMDRRG